MKIDISNGLKAFISSLSKLNIELKILLLQKSFSLVCYLRMLHKNWKLSFIIIILLCWTMIDFVGLCLTLFDFLKLCWTLLIFVWLCLTLFEFDNLCLTLVNLRSYAQILCLFWKHPKLFCLYLSNQISLRGRFVFKTNGRISSITSYRDHCYSLFTSWEIKQQNKIKFL